jgi:endonuclease/exonuclease/phosphatase family metal-dependent hydrolase
MVVSADDADSRDMISDPEPPASFRLLSWNIRAGRGDRLADQVRSIVDRQPDLVALQEVIHASAPVLHQQLAQVGYPHAIDSFAMAADTMALRGPRRYGLLIACRWPILALPADFPIPWPERVLSARIDHPAGTLELHTTHVPPGSGNGWTKIETFLGIHQRLAVSSPVPRILCGDFNEPRGESPDGRYLSWGARPGPLGRFARQDPERWDAAVVAVLAGLASHDMGDAYRSVNVHHGGSDWSWRSIRRGQTTYRRYDHVLSSRSLSPSAARYLHGFVDGRLSDHAAVEVDYDHPSESRECPATREG